MEHTTTTLMSIIIREMRDLLFKGAELMCTKPQTADERAMLDREQAEWANKTRYFLLADDATAGVNNTTAAFGEFESGDEDQEQEEDEDQDQVQDEDEEDEDEDDEDEDEDVVRKETKHDYAKLPPAAIVSSSGKAAAYGGGGGSSGSKAASAYGGGGSSGSSKAAYGGSSSGIGSKAAAYGGGGGIGSKAASAYGGSSKAVGGGTGVGGGGRINNKRKASEMELRQMTMKVEETSDGQITERSMRKLMAAFQQFDGEEEVTAVYQKHYVSNESEEDDD